MSVCPFCNQSNSDPGAAFCPRCGAPLDELEPRGWSEANPKAVAVALGALLVGFVIAVVLSYGSGGPSRDRAARVMLAPGQSKAPRRGPATATSKGFDGSWWKLAAAPFRGKLAVDAGALLPLAHMQRYSAGGYSFAYPRGWLISRGDQWVGDYHETVLETANGAAKVTVDFSPGETLAPAAKAAQVESATSATPGYSRIAFGPATVAGRSAFAWEFHVADAYPRRADLFIATAGGGFALLAYGDDLARARAAARAIAGTLTPPAQPAV
jgi:hypothetical protein